MRFYIATALERAADHRALAARLRDAGHELTYDWTWHGRIPAGDLKALAAAAAREIDGVVSADVVVVLLPGGHGTHAELGAALAAGRRVVLHASDETLVCDAGGRTCAFYWHSMVERIVLPWAEFYRAATELVRAS